MTRRGGTDGDRELLQRCDETTLALDRLCVDRFDRVEGGFAALTPSLPLVWDLNYVMFEKPASDQPRLDAERMAEISDAALGGAGLEHRTVMTSDPAEDERVEPGLRRLGWEVEGKVFMVLRSEPDTAPEDGVREVPHPLELRRAILREDDDFLRQPPEQLDALIEQLIESERRLAAADGDSWFVAEADGAPASATWLLSHGGVGMIDAVGTLLSARGRGLARATVQAAIEASRANGNEVTFLIAEEDDWPRHFYERLGFASVGTFRTFRKRPGSEETPADAGT